MANHRMYCKEPSGISRVGSSIDVVTQQENAPLLIVESKCNGSEFFVYCGA